MRINQLQEDEVLLQRLNSTLKYSFQTIDVNPLTIEDDQDISEYLVGLFNKDQSLGFTASSLEMWVNHLNKEKKSVVLIIPQADKYLSDTNHHVLGLFTSLIEKYFPIFSFLQVYETNVAHERNDIFTSTRTKLLQNIYYYPLYRENDILLFLSYLEKKWSFELSGELKKELINSCGGYFWLLKESARLIRNGVEDYFKQPSVDLRIRTVFQHLQEGEQKILEKTVFKQNDILPTEEQDKIYLQKVNIMNQDGRCTIKLLSDYIQYRVSGDDLVLLQDKISLNKVPLDYFLSRKEYRILRLLLKDRGSLVTRQQLAEVIWPDHNEEYSDWAIDQLMTRLRKRLESLSLSSTILQSVRGKGYILRK